MKDVDELNIPADVRYTKDHEWARAEGVEIRIGITDYAQDLLGDVVYVEVPEVGATYSKGDPCGTLESVKAVAEIFIPVGGRVAAVNKVLEQSPGLVNQGPYSDGWIALIEPSEPSEMDSLMTSDAYLVLVKGLKA